MEQKPINHAEEIVDKARLLSLATGKLYDLQILNLKYIPLVVFGEELSNEFHIDFDSKTIVFYLTGKSDYPESEAKIRLEYLIHQVKKFIGNFEVSVVLNEKKMNKDEPEQRQPNKVNRKNRKNVNKKRTGRVRKVRKRK
jgi:hypothetical protein